jgi:hypothetical protein
MFGTGTKRTFPNRLVPFDRIGIATNASGARKTRRHAPARVAYVNARKCALYLKINL